MKYDVIFRNANLVNRGIVTPCDLAVLNGRIARISSSIDAEGKSIDLGGKYLLPGVIDDQVHFREPGLTHKADIGTESRAAVAGGVTSFMEMPNTKPPAITQELLQDKYDIAAGTSPANYSFYMGVSNDNLEEALKTNPSNVCGLKIFMGSSTGNMLVDDPNTLDSIFSRTSMLIATHCEDEDTVRRNIESYVQKYGDHVPAHLHGHVRSREACYMSSSSAIELARKYGTRLHVLHITTKEEVDLFKNDKHRSEKLITSEACVHHLTYSEEDYHELGYQIKCNPAIKTKDDRDEIWAGVLDGRIDVIATDHAPHTWEEKQGTYKTAPSGLPLIQHTLNLMMHKVSEGVFRIEDLVDKMCHAPTDLFKIVDRGYADEGKWADLVVVDLDKTTSISNDDVLYKCGWTPLNGKTLNGRVEQTWVNGNLVFDGVKVHDQIKGQRLQFVPR